MKSRHSSTILWLLEIAVVNLLYCRRVDSFTIVGSFFFPRPSSTTVFLSESPSSPLTPPPNEFIRTVDPDKIPRSNNRNIRGYTTQITATPQECQKLAQRFELPAIHALTADMTISIRGSRGGNNAVKDLWVEGTMAAVVTRTCVRTGQEFSMELSDLPLQALVRPMAPNQLFLLQDNSEAASAQKDKGNSSSKSKRNKNSIRSSANTQSSLDLEALQKIMELQDDEDDMLMEDEAIYRAGSSLDVGELVAQLFWLSLDPYPKKPGSDPVQMSMTSN